MQLHLGVRKSSLLLHEFFLLLGALDFVLKHFEGWAHCAEDVLFQLFQVCGLIGWKVFPVWDCDFEVEVFADHVGPDHTGVLLHEADEELEVEGDQSVRALDRVLGGTPV